MNIKTKITLALAFLFIVILFLGGLGAYYLHGLSGEVKEILKDNYESLEYVRNMRVIVDNNNWSNENIDVFAKNLKGQEENITEVGEKESTRKLRNEFQYLLNNPDSTLNNKLRTELNKIEELNMQAIVRKNNIMQETTERVRLYMIFVAITCALITFTFIINFPSYIADPISTLTESIKQIANKNYEQRLNFKSDDEFGELAYAFNEMAQRLDEYEHSNLAQLTFEKRRIETIIDNMHDAIIGLDENNKILFVNPMMEKILGIDEKQIAGKYAPDVALHNDLLRNLLKDNNSIKPMQIFADGKESYFSRETFEVKNHENLLFNGQTPSTIGQVIVLKNVTAYQEIDLAKTNFIATISHELKTPISSIKMSLKLLNDERVGNLNNEQKVLIENIEEDSHRLLKITTELLDLAQVETGNIQLHLQPTEPKEIIEYAVKSLEFQALQKEIKLEINCPDNLPNVQVDLEKTAWVLVNFLSNAIRYSVDKSKIIISVKQSENKITFSVQDFGRGIDEKFQNRIFDKFFKVPNGDYNKSGTGLGLAISKDFIISQGGVIGLESEIGKGSIFYFSI